MTPSLAKTSLHHALSDKKFNVLSRAEFNWASFYDNAENATVFYDDAYIEFRLECSTGNGFVCEDFSFGVVIDGRIIAVVPLFFHENNESKSLSFLEGTIPPPLFASFVSDKLATIEQVTSTLTHFVFKCYKTHGVECNSLDSTDRLSVVA